MGRGCSGGHGAYLEACAGHYRPLAEVLVATGLPITTLRLHDFRHSAAASWLAAGLPLICVQRQLGHASTTTTEASTGTWRRASFVEPRSAPSAEDRVEAPAAAFA